VKLGRRVIYTAPIKALSNQKFRDFRAQYGAERVGLMTGDLVENGDAPLVVMTTEVYRNMLLQGDETEVAAVIFDEVHYMADPERGTAWEEAIILAPPSVKMVCLSATVPNAAEIAAWLAALRQDLEDRGWGGSLAAPDVRLRHCLRCLKSAWEMTKVECQMTKEARSSNDETRADSQVSETALALSFEREVARGLSRQRLECGQLAAAFGGVRSFESAGKPDALHTLRDFGSASVPREASGVRLVYRRFQVHGR